MDKVFNFVVENPPNFNSQVPIGYVLVALAVLWGGYYLFSKTVSLASFAFGKLSTMAFAAAAKLSFSLLCSGWLLLAGLTGGGWAIGSLNSSPAGVQTKPKNEYVLTNSDLKSFTGPSLSADKLQMLLDYAKERDKLLVSSKEMPVSSNYLWETYDQKNCKWAEVVQLDPSPVAATDYSTQCAVLAMSIGLMICSVVVFAFGKD